MVDIFHDFPVKAAPREVMAAFATPAGLDAWWTLRAEGRPIVGTTYRLFFGENYDWRGEVTRYLEERELEWRMVCADADWAGTRVGVELDPKDGMTWVRFAHSGWPAANEHMRTSSYCWAMYLRLLKRYVEYGEVVPYEERLDA